MQRTIWEKECVDDAANLRLILTKKILLNLTTMVTMITMNKGAKNLADSLLVQ